MNQRFLSVSVEATSHYGYLPEHAHEPIVDPLE
jgi:hypothetical protein